MKVTAYNQLDCIEYLKARALLLLMSPEVPSISGKYASPLFDIVGGEFNENQAKEIVAAFEGCEL